MRFSRTPVHITRAGPALGADTGAVLAELGLSSHEIAALVSDGVVVA
jgi:crotonobetainyl-CoA:carnitine CoA-transferase CaiB-like acyl-CoA transferase